MVFWIHSVIGILSGDCRMEHTDFADALINLSWFIKRDLSCLIEILFSLKDILKKS